MMKKKSRDLGRRAQCYCYFYFGRLLVSHAFRYARCTRSVSIVPPAYYAHLAAFRARYYMEPDMSDNGSLSTGTGNANANGNGNAHANGKAGTRNNSNGNGNGTRVGVRQLPALKENVKKVMFYC